MKNIYSLISALLCAFALNAQDFYDEATVQTISITFAQSNWDALLDAEKAGNEDYIMAQSVTVNGVIFDSVGVKYKGNSTYNANQTKNPFHIELDTYKEHDYEGYTDIKLSNVAKDPSFIREVLGYKILRNYMVAPLSNYANVYVNGDLIGLYANSESVSKKFVKKYFGSKTNTFVKCNPPEGAGQGTTDLPNLTYNGIDSTAGSYADAYEIKSDYGWKELINLCDTLNNSISDIEEILDVDRVLWMLAFDNMTVNLDSYIGGFAQNYYLYRDDFGRFLPVVWDLNESFGTFSMTGSGNLNSTNDKQQLDYFLNESDVNYPLISKLLSNPTYKKMYLAHCKTFLTENFTNNGSYYTEGQVLQSVIDSDVQADQNKFYTYANFTSNLTTDLTSGGGPGGPGGPGGSSTPGITNLMNGRYSYLMTLTEFAATEPTISAIAVSNLTPIVGETLNISVNVINEEYVFFRYRTEIRAPFEKVAMYDDGLHNDGAANDNVYGIDVVMTNAIMEYYIYAENSTIGKFSPTNAEHEFYTLVAQASESIEDVVINEFMASNDLTVADQDGDYDDWIEIYNKGNVAIDLSDYAISDDASDFSLFTFPLGTVINANSYLIVWADKDLTQSGYHADFKLSASGETIYLVNSISEIIDSVEYSNQTTDISTGRFPNGTGNFQEMNPTFNIQNSVSTVGLDDFFNDKAIVNIYPNPATSSFNIELSSATSEDLDIQVYDIHSKLIYSDVLSNRITVNILGWSKGLYFVKVGGIVKKLIIN